MKVYIKFYGVSDMARAYYVQESLKKIEKFSPTRTRYSINEILELHNITKYIDAGLYLATWTSAEKNKFISSGAALHRSIDRYFKQINKQNFLSRFRNVKPVFHKDLIELYEKKNLPGIITERQFFNMVKIAKVSLISLLSNKALVDRYEGSIRKLFISNERNAEILLKKYVIRSDERERLINIPKSLTDTDKEKLVIDYLNSKAANLNYVKHIGNIHKSADLNLSPKTKLFAKQKELELGEEIFKSGVDMSHEFEVIFAEDQEDAVLKVDTAELTRRSISQKWLEENIDYPTILQNFIYLFEFVDQFMRINLTNTYFEMGIVERFLEMKARRDYDTGFAFTSKESIAKLEIHGYQTLLKEKGLSIEKTLEWFFDTYLAQEFNVEGFNVSLPSEGATYKEKCVAIFPEMEGMLKQFSSYVTDGEVNHSLIALTTDQFNFSLIPSMLKKKYLYVVQDSELPTVLNLLFSDQTGLGYVDDKISKPTFFELISNHEIKEKRLNSWQVESIKILKKYKILILDKGYLKFGDNSLLYLLVLLNDKSYVHYHNLDDNLKLVADKLLRKGWLYPENRFLAKAESEYFNYYLNKIEFDNGPNLRNLYAHGSNISKGNEDQIVDHYYTGLMLFILLVIKINDEFDNI